MKKQTTAFTLIAAFAVICLIGCSERDFNFFESRQDPNSGRVGGQTPLNPHLTPAEDFELLKTEILINASKPWDPITSPGLIPTYRRIDGYSVIAATPLYNHVTEQYAEQRIAGKKHWNIELEEWESDFDFDKHANGHKSPDYIVFQEDVDSKVKFFVRLNLFGDEEVAYRAGHTYEFPITIKRIEAMVWHDAPPPASNVRRLTRRSYLPQHLQADAEVVELRVICKLILYHHLHFGNR